MPKREDENWVSWRESDLRFCPGCKKFVSASDFWKYHYGKCFQAESLPSQQQAPQLYRCPRCGRDSLFKHPKSGLYECLDRDCQAVFASTYIVEPASKPGKSLHWEAKAGRYVPYDKDKYSELKATYEPPRYTITPTLRAYRRPRKFPWGRVIAILIVFAVIGAVVCAFADIAPFSTAKDKIVGYFSGSDIPPSEDHPYWEYFGKQPPYSKTQFGGRIHLVNNEDATDPTWQQLEAFLLADGTDDNDYNQFSFPCGAFAEELHNNAEEAGIKAAWVSVEFEGDGSDHALNAFNTTDRRLVFVDCTGRNVFTVSLPQPASFGGSGGQTTPVERDKIAYVALGKEYGLISLNVVEDLSYDSYERYMEDWDAYKTAVEAYNDEVNAYNRLYETCGGYATYGECYRLLSWYDELDSQKAELDRHYTELGGYYWQPLGVVEEVEIWW